jgi:uncharacterized membrane protein YphA (DoxX/SURF4 family)
MKTSALTIRLDKDLNDLLTKGLWPVLNQGMPAILFCFLWLYLSAAGPGAWSIDAMHHIRAKRSN